MLFCNSKFRSYDTSTFIAFMIFMGSFLKDGHN